MPLSPVPASQQSETRYTPVLNHAACAGQRALLQYALKGVPACKYTLLSLQDDELQCLTDTEQLLRNAKYSDESVVPIYLGSGDNRPDPCKHCLVGGSRVPNCSDGGCA